jgi:hypothetical protein
MDADDPMSCLGSLLWNLGVAVVAILKIIIGVPLALLLPPPKGEAWGSAARRRVRKVFSKTASSAGDSFGP